MTERIIPMTSGAAVAVRKLEEHSEVAVSRESGMAGIATSEPMFRIATRLLMSLSAEEKIVACAGIRAGDPSGEFAMNLAVAIARLGHGPVLLVDANFRERTITKFASGTSYRGLGDLLEAEQQDTVAIQAMDIEGLNLLTAGEVKSITPARLSSIHMGALLDGFRRFVAVIMDVGAVLDNSDSLLMASRADVVVATAAAGERTRSELNSFKAETKLLPSRLIGIVLTEVK